MRTDAALTLVTEKPMTKAGQPNTAPLSPVQQAAAEILALVNSSPRTPWPEEIEAIIAKVAGAPT